MGKTSQACKLQKNHTATSSCGVAESSLSKCTGSDCLVYIHNGSVPALLARKQQSQVLSPIDMVSYLTQPCTCQRPSADSPWFKGPVWGQGRLRKTSDWGPIARAHVYENRVFVHGRNRHTHSLKKPTLQSRA